MSDTSNLSAFPGAASAPVDPRTTLGYRFWKSVVIVLGVLIVIAFSLVVYGLIRKPPAEGPPAAAQVALGEVPAVFTLPAGAQILAMQTSGDRLVLQVRTRAGDEVDIIDLNSGRLVGQVKAPPASP